MNFSAETLRAVYDTTYYVVFNFTKAVTAAIQRDSFLYWPFLVSSVIIAALAWRWTVYAASSPERRSWREFFRDYFGAQIWWHRSARADYVLYAANALLLPLLFGYVLASETQVAGWIDAALGGSAGPRVGATPAAGGGVAVAAQGAAEPVGMAVRILFTLAFFIAYDFGRFLAHSLLHDVPLLWEFHKVHHSAQVLTPITTYRVHPVDLLVMAWGPALTTGVLAWAFNRFAAGSVTFYSFLGVHALMWAFNLIGNLRHSPVWLSYGPVLGRWLISPAHHQLHHSCEPRHLGCNRGFEIAVWDRLYGTLYVPPVHAESFRMGLGDETDGKFHTLWRMYFWPFGGAARAIRLHVRGRVQPSAKP
jgi:sterol desaturase/sphingolipid hydroxylase (fatty acid hydroxylase superfamily)